MTNQLNNIEGILFDLDNTLYPSTKGVFHMVNERINNFVMDLTGDAISAVRELRKEYIGSHGTTLGGLIHYHGIDPEQYLDFVHDVPVDDLLDPSSITDDMLRRITIPKVIFTNASASHAESVLDALQIRHHFQDICDLEAVEYVGKPSRSSFRKALSMLGTRPECTILVDDLPANLLAASEMGLLAVQVGDEDNHHDFPMVEDMEALGGMFSGADWFVDG